MSKKLILILSLLLLIILKNIIYTPLPSKKTPRLIYSNQARYDLQKSLKKSLYNAKKDIFISVYSLTDHQIIDLLNQKAETGTKVSLHIDPKQLKIIKKKLSEKIEIFSRPMSGLMHHKVFLVDDITYLGSANLTPSSLRMHDNLMVGLLEPELNNHLRQSLPNAKNESYSSLNGNFELFFLPNKEALVRIIQLIESATKTIDIAMFTFTHPQIGNALLDAQQRGVQVRVVFDYLSHKGASRYLYKKLKDAHVAVGHHRGMQLMHHKFAIIDQKTLIMGSANWTQSAFSKNQDNVLIFSNLNQKEKKFMHSLWRNLWWEAKKQD